MNRVKPFFYTFHLFFPANLRQTERKQEAQQELKTKATFTRGIIWIIPNTCTRWVGTKKESNWRGVCLRYKLCAL